MKVGIMSMQRIINYGSYLQAFGLKAVIESMGHSVEFVDYLAEPSVVHPASGSGPLRRFRKVKNALKMLSPAYRKYRTEQIRMNQSFSEFCRRFTQEFLPDLGIAEQKNYLPVLDVLVIGSDEVFNCTQPGNDVGYSLQLFGRDHRAKKLISYAASFGYTTPERLDHYGIRDEVHDCLQSFDAISVRDDNSAEIVRELCGIRPLKHIDPVLLYDFPEADTISIFPKGYIVVYAYAGRISADEAGAIRAFAKKMNKKILSLGFWQPFCDEFIQATPMEVLAYIRNADYVVTDTFHGSIFSIKYQVPFVALIRESNQQKLGDLLSNFGLEGRSVTDLEELESVLRTPMNTEKIRGTLIQRQQEAKKYLFDMVREKEIG